MRGAALMRGRRFPIGVYATLLGALCWLAVPQLSLGVEAWLLGLTCLPLRAYADVSANIGRLVEPEAADWQRVQSLLDRQDLVAAEMPGAEGRQPVVCRVLDSRAPGGGRRNAELLLDRTYRELGACERFVTFGDRLLGFLAIPGQGPTVDDHLDDPARVLLLNHPLSESVPAFIATDADGVLRCIVEPAGSVDLFALRCGLWEDPYVASQVTESGGEVRTSQLDGTGVPAGLLLGICQVVGYPLGDQILPIGLFVEPAMAPRAISTVVLWRPQPGVEAQGLRRPLTGGSLEPVALSGVHAPRGESWFIHGGWSSWFPDDAALVRGLYFLGTVRGMGPGQGRVERLESSPRIWSFILLPDAGEPVGLRGEVVGEENGVVRIRPWGRDRGQLGYLFTGVNSLHCPAGLLVGEVLQVREDGQMLVSRVLASQGGGQGVFIRDQGER